MYMHRHLARHLSAYYRLIPGERLGHYWLDLRPYKRHHCPGWHAGTYSPR